MALHLRREGVRIGRRRAGRLIRLMGLQTVYRSPRTSDPHPEHRVYPYLLRGLAIERPNHVWCANITYWTTILGRFEAGKDAKLSNMCHVLTRNQHGHAVCGLTLERREGDGSGCGLIVRASCGARGSRRSWPGWDHCRSCKDAASWSVSDRLAVHHGALGL